MACCSRNLCYCRHYQGPVYEPQLNVNMLCEALHGHVLRIETHWFWIFPVLCRLIYSLILNLSLPFWSRFVYQPTCYFYWRPLCSLSFSLLLKRMCPLQHVSCLEQHTLTFSFSVKSQMLWTQLTLEIITLPIWRHTLWTLFVILLLCFLVMSVV